MRIYLGHVTAAMSTHTHTHTSTYKQSGKRDNAGVEKLKCNYKNREKPEEQEVSLSPARVGITRNKFAVRFISAKK